MKAKKKKVKNKKKISGLIVASVLAVAVVVTAVFVLPMFSGVGYETVVEDYVVAYVHVDTKAMSETSVCDFNAFYEAQLEADSGGDEAQKESFFEMASERYGKDINTIDEYMEASAEENRLGIEAQYGAYKVVVDIKEAAKLSEETLQGLRDDINEEKSTNEVTIVMGVDTDKISEGYILEIEVTMDGEIQSNTNTLKCTVVRYDGEWKVIPNY